LRVAGWLMETLIDALSSCRVAIPPNALASISAAAYRYFLKCEWHSHMMQLPCVRLARPMPAHPCARAPRKRLPSCDAQGRSRAALCAHPCESPIHTHARTHARIPMGGPHACTQDMHACVIRLHCAPAKHLPRLIIAVG
jgi:hypothetical protein